MPNLKRKLVSVGIGTKIRLLVLRSLRERGLCIMIHRAFELTLYRSKCLTIVSQYEATATI